MAQTVYDAMGGAEAVLALAHAWHERALADPVVEHAFHQGYRDDHTERLAAYWGEQLGGPPAYTEAMGDQTSVVRIHSGEGEHREMDERAIACFDAALDDAGIPDDERLRTSLRRWFRWGVEVMNGYPETADEVPEGMPLPRWSWEGPVPPVGRG